jgi:hypothetical protein
MSTWELVWFKSSYSSTGSGDCVEVAVAAALPHTIHIRDSKNSTGPQLALSLTAWADFVPYASQS